VPYYNRIYNEISISPAVDDMVLRAAELPPEIPIYGVTRTGMMDGQLIIRIDRNYAAIFLAFLADGRQFDVVDAENLNDEFFEALPAGKPVAFFVAGNDATLVQKLKQHLTLLPPIYTENVQIPQEKQFVLYNGVR
jgi:hypothetical protein